VSRLFSLCTEHPSGVCAAPCPDCSGLADLSQALYQDA
jgi:hypothetical protein